MKALEWIRGSGILCLLLGHRYESRVAYRDPPFILQYRKVCNRCGHSPR